MLIKKRKYTFIKLVFGLALIFYIGHTIYSNTSLNAIRELEITPHFLLFALSFIFLVPINWAIETIKWRMLLNKANSIVSFWNCYKLVLAGISTGIMTPNRIGNFVGRSKTNSMVDKKNGILGTFMANTAQFTATILMGSIGLFLLPKIILSGIEYVIIIQLISSVFILVSFYFFFNPTNRIILFLVRSFWPQYEVKLEEIKQLSTSKKTMVLFIALLRYTVIIAQFYFVLSFFLKSPPLSLTIGIAVSFLITTIVPSIAFGKLFVREASALFTLSLFLVPAEIILCATFILWLFNLAIPSLFGAFILLKK